MRAQKRCGIARIAFRGEKEHLVAIRPHGGHLVSQTLRWPDEVRAADVGDYSKTRLAKKELDMAKLLVWSFLAGFSERLVPDTLAGMETRASNPQN